VFCRERAASREACGGAGLLDSLGWHGFAMVEFRSTSPSHMLAHRNQRALLGSLQLAVDLCADSPGSCTDRRRRKPENPADYSIGNRLRWWLGDLDIYMPVCATRADTDCAGQG